MSHGIHGERFFGRQDSPAWHKLGFITLAAMRAVEALRVGLKGGYWYDKRADMIMIDGKLRDTGDFRIVRSAIPDDPHEKIISGAITGRYDIIQPLEIAEMFDQYVDQPVETMGLLFEGSKLFLTWKLLQYELENGDLHNAYGLITCGFDGLWGTTLHVVDQRVVCNNTHGMALRESTGNGKGKLFSGRHISPTLRRDLAEWMKFVQGRAVSELTLNIQEQNRLEKIPVSQSKAQEVLERIYPNPKEVSKFQPDVIKAEQDATYSDKVSKAELDRELVMNLFNGLGTAINATAYGLFCSVSEYEDWGRMTKKPAEQSILVGNRAKTKAYAWNVITNTFR